MVMYNRLLAKVKWNTDLKDYTRIKPVESVSNSSHLCSEFKHLMTFSRSLIKGLRRDLQRKMKFYALKFYELLYHHCETDRNGGLQ